MRKKTIEFFDITNSIPEQFYPSPAIKVIPDWYKNSLSHMGGKKEIYVNDKGLNSSTIKRCIPVFDAISTGYIVVTDCDIEITSSHEGVKYFKWSKNRNDVITFHIQEQMQRHHKSPGVGQGAPKWTNPWAIKTPRGYSSLFIPPMHRPNVIQILEGVVDTDSYTSPVNLPFSIDDESFQGVIPAGTPIAQVIPFRRDSFEHSVRNASDGHYQELQENESNIFSTFFNAYKDRFWNRKQYN